MRWNKNVLTKKCLNLGLYEETEVSLNTIYSAIRGKNKGATDYLFILQKFFIPLGCCYKITGDNVTIMRFMSLN